jgi:hypothetical protein
MSFATSLVPPAAALARGAQNVLCGSTIREMGRMVGVVLSAGALAAVYQVTHDEMRLTLNRWRARSQFRQQRHEALLTALLGSSLSVPAQNRLISSGDAFKAALRLLIDTTTSVEDRSVLIGAIRGLSVTPSLQ